MLWRGKRRGQHNIGKWNQQQGKTDCAKGGGKVTRAPGPVKFGTTVIAFVEDPDGYKIELIERT